MGGNLCKESGRSNTRPGCCYKGCHGEESGSGTQKESWYWKSFFCRTSCQRIGRTSSYRKTRVGIGTCSPKPFPKPKERISILIFQSINFFKQYLIFVNSNITH